MNLKLNNVQGFTLIELLAALVLFSIFGIIAWSFFFQSLEFNDVEITKNQLQQEANLIINNIQELHTTADSYTVLTDAYNLSLTITSKENVVTFNQKNVQYNIKDSKVLSNGNYYLHLTLSSKEKPVIKFETETIFSRLR